MTSFVMPILCTAFFAPVPHFGSHIVHPFDPFPALFHKRMHTYTLSIGIPVGVGG